VSRLSRRKSAEAVQWLQANPTLEELVEAYPDEWRVVQRDFSAMIDRGDTQELQEYVTRTSQPRAAMPGRAPTQRALLSEEIRRQMAIHLLKQAILSASTGVAEGRVRFNLVNGFVAQRLLFRRGLQRKPVSMPAFRMLWPLLTQRRLLMPLVQPKGIWCFCSHPLITALAGLIGDRPCLEIAAGDGTLTRFLTAAGTQVTATDDHSWHDSITYGSTVLHQDARTALRAHRPEVVVCSWPPAGNPFEQPVFTTPSVQQYIVIGSRRETATGNRAAYRRQTTFHLSVDERLSRLVLPPETDPAVYVFTRTAPR
jgi:hypothetical protein